MANDINKPLEIAPGVALKESDLPGAAKDGFGQNLSGSTSVGRGKGNRDLASGPQASPLAGSPFKNVKKKG